MSEACQNTVPLCAKHQAIIGSDFSGTEISPVHVSIERPTIGMVGARARARSRLRLSDIALMVVVDLRWSL